MPATRINTTPLIGANVDNGVISTTALRSQGIPGQAALGAQTLTNDGKLMVYAEASGAITANTAVCTVNTTTFQATNTGGSYLSPAVALATGDRAWFVKQNA